MKSMGEMIIVQHTNKSVIWFDELFENRIIFQILQLMLILIFSFCLGLNHSAKDNSGTNLDAGFFCFK